MKRLATTLVFLAACLVTLSGAAADPAEAVDPHVKEFAFLVGEWDAQYTIGGGPNEKYRLTCRWLMDGKFIEVIWSDASGKHVGTEIHGWDAAAKTLKMWGFWADTIYESKWLREGDTFTGHYDVVLSTGATEKHRIVVSKRSNDSLEATGWRIGENEPFQKATFTRRKK